MSRARGRKVRRARCDFFLSGSVAIRYLFPLMCSIRIFQKPRILNDFGVSHCARASGTATRIFSVECKSAQ